MKKKIYLSLFLLLGATILSICGITFFRQYRKHSQSPVSITIASDIHYLSPEYRGTYFKEPSAMFDGKLIHYSTEYFDAFLAEITQKQPNILILSGDITLNGSLKSHEEVIEKLNVVQSNGTQVLVLPGNHDLNSAAGDYNPAEPMLVESASEQNFFSMYENFGPSQAISRDANTFSYIYEASPYLWILMLDTNSLRKGFVEADTLEWLETQLKKAKNLGIDVLSVSHQNLHIHNELLYFSYQMYNADELLALYEKYDVLLNLSGHIHVQSIVSSNTAPNVSVPEIAVGSLGVCGTPYGELTYDGNAITYQTVKTDVSSYAAAQGYQDENLLHFNEYSYWYFEEVGRLQTRDAFLESDLSDSEKELLADTFARINAQYFVGNAFSLQEYSDGIQLWHEQENNFVSRYIDTMIQEAGVNNQTLYIQLN